ncbi:MAG: nucleotide exchange factor GrpE [Prevotella sp.]|nr:nucleotide exchange factor GrpE [Prevotella sp.]
MIDEEELNRDEEPKNEDIPVEETPAEQEAADGEETAEKQPDSTEEQDPLDIALHKIEELNTKYKYLAAEFDNYRKRTLKERAELILNGSEKTVSAVLPVIDDMERAIKNGEKEEDPAVLREGMSMIYHKTMKVLEGLGVQKIDTTDADFNTDMHEAVAMVPGMGDDKKGKVIDCLATGYKLNDKVIRHAKVAVGQ